MLDTGRLSASRSRSFAEPSRSHGLDRGYVFSGDLDDVPGFVIGPGQNHAKLPGPFTDRNADVSFIVTSLDHRFHGQGLPVPALLKPGR